MEGIPQLKAYRESQTPRLTQKELAKRLDVKKGTISRWEAGERRIDEKKLTAVAEETGIPKRVLRPDLAELLGEAAE